MTRRRLVDSYRTFGGTNIPYILESNPHPFYSFRGLKNQMRIRIACGLDSRSRAGFRKNVRAAVRVVRTIKLFIILFIIYIIYYIIFIIYYSSDSPSSLITESLPVTQSLSSLSSPWSSHRMSSSDPSKALLMQHFLKDPTIILSGMAFHAADTHGATSEGAARKGRLKESCGLEPRINFFFRLRNRQKLVRIRFVCGLDSRIYGMCGDETWDTSESRSEISGKFEMWCWRRIGRASWTDHMKNEEVLHRVKERNILRTAKSRKANWIGHILCRNCLLKHIFEGKIKETARPGRRHKQQLGKHKDMRE